MRSFFDAGQGAANASRRAFAPPPSDTVNALQLAANTSERVPIPAGATTVSIAATADVYVKFGNSSVQAAVPGDVTNGSASSLNPAARSIPSDATHIAAISEQAAKVTFEFWS